MRANPTAEHKGGRREQWQPLAGLFAAQLCFQVKELLDCFACLTVVLLFGCLCGKVVLLSSCEPPETSLGDYDKHVPGSKKHHMNDYCVHSSKTSG